MRHFVNLVNGNVTLDLADLNHQQSGSQIQFGGGETVEVLFHRNGTPELLPPGTDILLGIKPQGQFEGNYLTSVTGFAVPTSPSGFYTAALPTDTQTLRTALLIDGNPSNDVPSIPTTQCAWKWWPDGPTAQPRKSRGFSITVNNDPNQGGEAEPGSATPIPSPDALQAAVAQAAAALPASSPRALSTLDFDATRYNVQFVGDSTTYGLTATTGQGTCYPTVYPGIVIGDLNAGLPTPTWAGTNLGVSGKRAIAMAADAPVQAAAAYDPNKINVVVVFAGINDLSNGAYSPDDTADRVNDICAAWRAAGFGVVLVNLPQDIYYSETIRQEFNGFLTDTWPACADAFADLTTLSAFAYGAPAPGPYIGDGQHPNDAGYALIGHLVSPLVRQVGQRMTIGQRVTLQQSLAKYEINHALHSCRATIPGGAIAAGTTAFVDVPLATFRQNANLYRLEFTGNYQAQSNAYWRQDKVLLCAAADNPSAANYSTATEHFVVPASWADASTWSFSYPDAHTLRVTFASQGSNIAGFFLTDHGQ